MGNSMGFWMASRHAIPILIAEDIKDLAPLFHLATLMDPSTSSLEWCNGDLRVLWFFFGEKHHEDNPHMLLAWNIYHHLAHKWLKCR